MGGIGKAFLMVLLVVEVLRVVEVHAFLDEIPQSHSVKVIVGDEIVLVKFVHPEEQWRHLFFE